jgi:hypothetical protein
VKVFGEHATTGIDIGLHSIDRVWSRYEGPPASGGGIARALAAATVEENDVVLVQMIRAVPEIRRGIRECRGASCDLIARVSAPFQLVVQLDRPRAAGQGELRCVDPYPAKQALQALVSDRVIAGILSMPSRDGELGHAQVLRCDGRLALVGGAVDTPWQPQQGYWRSLHNRIVGTLVGDRGNRDLASPPPELHDE